MDVVDDVYDPVDPNYYDYEALDSLDQNIDEYLNNNIVSKIEICGFEIDNSGRSPFIKYLFEKSLSSNVLLFPSEKLNYEDLKSESLIIYTKIKLFNLLHSQNYNHFETKIQCKGFYVLDDVVKIFYDLTECKVHINDIFESNTMWFCLIDEIINYQCVLNFTVDENITNFFKNNMNFCFLRDKNNVRYEVPSLYYAGRNSSMTLNFTQMFGVSPSNKNNILGPYYYFTDLQTAVRDGCWTKDYTPATKYGKVVTDNADGRYINGGIVRFALFLGKMKKIENFQKDANDMSDTKRERLNDLSLNQPLEILTMRISDHDGKWAENYDSAYIGHTELDNGEYLENTPVIVVKNYDQQIPLSYHYINKSTLTKKYDKNQRYLIL
jgi:hypothetical protein